MDCVLNSFTPRAKGTTTATRKAEQPIGLDWQKKKTTLQRAKKVVSDSPGLEDFAIGLVNSVFNLPNGQVMFYEEFE